jgi:hypothetical protein
MYRSQRIWNGIQEFKYLGAVIDEKNNIVTCLGTGDAVQIVNGSYYNLTRRDYNYLLHCYLFTQLHANLSILFAVVFAYSVSLSLKHLNSLQLFFTYELPMTVSYRELLCSANGFQDNSSARTPRKTVAALLRVRLSSRCIAMVTARTHRKPVT